MGFFESNCGFLICCTSCIVACMTLTASALPSSPDTCPNNASYYGNRAATLMMLGRFREALGDAQQSVRLDDRFVRVRGKRHHSSSCLNTLVSACCSSCSSLLPVFSGPFTGREVPPFPGECHGCQPLLSTSSRTGS